MSIPPIGPYVAASAWGAKHGPRLIRRISDGGRTWRAALLIGGYALFRLMLGAAWVFAVVQGAPLVSLVLGLAAMGSAFVVVEAAARWWFVPRSTTGPVLTTSPGGRPATAWLRSGASLVRPFAGWLLLVMAAAGEVAASWIGGHVWGLVAPAVLVALAAWSAWPLLRGRVTAGGLYLTPDGVEHVWGSAVTSAAWDDVVPLPLHGPFGLGAAAGLQHRSGGWHVQDPVDRVTKGDVSIPLAYLPSPAALVRQQVDEYLHHPQRRRELGAPRSLEWYRARALGLGDPT